MKLFKVIRAIMKKFKKRSMRDLTPFQRLLALSIKRVL